VGCFGLWRYYEGELSGRRRLNPSECTGKKGEISRAGSISLPNLDSALVDGKGGRKGLAQSSGGVLAWGEKKKLVSPLLRKQRLERREEVSVEGNR